MENNNITIKAIDIKKVIELLTLKLDNFDENSSITLDKDFYWYVPDDELYNVYESPNNLTIGSLIEDWNFLQSVVSGKREILDYDLNKISMLLRYLSNKIP